jgi:hypothetical protein
MLIQLHDTSESWVNPDLVGLAVAIDGMVTDDKERYRAFLNLGIQGYVAHFVYLGKNVEVVTSMIAEDITRISNGRKV